MRYEECEQLICPCQENRFFFLFFRGIFFIKDVTTIKMTK